MVKDMKHKVFVYGTLRKGLENHSQLENAKFLGLAKTKEKYKLTASSIPFVSKSEKISHIIGEVYEVDDRLLEKLDIFEDHPDWYKREKIKVILENGKEIDAWIYFNEITEEKELIQSGDYKEFVNTP